MVGKGGWRIAATMCHRSRHWSPSPSIFFFYMDPLGSQVLARRVPNPPASGAPNRGVNGVFSQEGRLQVDYGGQGIPLRPFLKVLSVGALLDDFLCICHPPPPPYGYNSPGGTRGRWFAGGGRQRGGEGNSAAAALFYMLHVTPSHSEGEETHARNSQDNTCVQRLGHN